MDMEIWAYETKRDLYFKDFYGKKMLEKILDLFIPICEHEDFETKEHCREHGEPCYLPAWDENEKEEILWVCYRHMEAEGFCRSCGQFCAGIDSFDFGRYHGYCDNCASEIEQEEEGWS